MLTLTDPRLALWEQRRTEQQRVATLRIYRASCCRCTHCHDDDKADELDNLINQSLERITVINDRICEREITC